MLMASCTRQDDQPSGRDGALHQESWLETRVILISGHDERGHLDPPHVLHQLPERGPAPLDLAASPRPQTLAAEVEPRYAVMHVSSMASHDNQELVPPRNASFDG
jgi:hypothetical protein